MLHDNEAFCTNCGTISGTAKKGTILIKANKVMPLGLSLSLLGIAIIIVISILLIKGINIGFVGRCIICIRINTYYYRYNYYYKVARVYK